MIHILSAPLFVAGLVLLFVKPWVGLALILGVVAIQGFGHSKEAKGSSQPFLSPLDFVVRFITENTITFWRFLFSGGYATNFRANQQG